MKYREYAYTGRWADGSLHTDTVYVAHPEPKQGCDTCGWTTSSDQAHTCGGPLRTLTMPRNDDRIVYNVQDYPSKHLATTMDRKWAAQWLRIRRLAGLSSDDPRVAPLIPLSNPAWPNDGGAQYNNPATGHHELRIREGAFYRRIPMAEYVPNMPVDAYARANTVVLHDTGDGGMSGYGYKSGETAEGVRYTEQRLDCSGYDDFHLHTECDEHDEITPDCEQCDLVVGCNMGNCDCLDRLEACAICDRPQGDGDTVWLCLDGGEIICPEHVMVDERPDSLFTKVGGVRGAMLPPFAWPGGYTIVYLTRDNTGLCAECASKVDTSDPAVDAEVDEEMDCLDCGHAQNEHASEKAHRTDGNSDDVGPCSAEITREDTYGREHIYGCSCEGYWPPQCEGCNKPIDPALRQWWANLRGEKVTSG